MKKKNILDIAIKILGLMYILQGFIFLSMIGPSMAMTISNPDIKINRVISVCSYSLIGIILFVIGYLLIKKSIEISNKIIDNEEIINIDNTCTWKSDLFELSLKIMGMICLIKSVPNILQVISRPLINGRINDLLEAYNIAQIMSEIVLFCIGIYLLKDGSHILKLSRFKKIE